MTSTKGWLFISLLKAGNKPIAYEYSLAYQGTVYHLKTAFDPEFSHYDPGYSLKHFTLTEIIEHMPSIQEYDFLGDAESYKLKWTPHVRPHVKVHIYRPRSGYPRLLHFIQSKLIVPIKDRRLESH
jgi:CelD/BcsL family acetyltransferase involved in cellulose biosynthesis